MIYLNDLTEKDKGRMVIYRLNGISEKSEQGVIVDWNNSFIFVQYKGDVGSKATRPKDLEFAFK